MIFVVGSLADGQLPAAKAALYTATAVKAIIHKITVVNTDSSARTFNLYRKRAAGTSKLITPANCSLGVGYLAETEKPFTLSAGDSIEGDASVALKLDYTINGVEEV